MIPWLVSTFIKANKSMKHYLRFRRWKAQEFLWRNGEKIDLKNQERYNSCFYHGIIIIWLALQMGKMKRILCSDWLPKRARWACLAHSGFPALFPQNKILWPYNKSFIDQACLVKMAGYWPRSFFPFLLTSTLSRSIKTQTKKNLANIQPPWPHAWSITHI